jgi:hypothetical protein
VRRGLAAAHRGGSRCAEGYIASGARDPRGARAKRVCSLRKRTPRILTESATRVSGECGGRGARIGFDGAANIEDFSGTGGRFALKLSGLQS